MTIITIANQKGGVGKTTTAVTLAHGCARLGRRTLLIDLDPQGNVSLSLGIQKAPDLFEMIVQHKSQQQVTQANIRQNLDVIRSDNMTAVLKVVLAGYDFREYVLTNALLNDDHDVVIFDLPPSVDILHTAALVASDYLVVPTQLDQFSVQGIQDLLTTLATVRSSSKCTCVLAGIIPTLFERSTRESHGQLTNMVEAYQHLVWPPIPKDVKCRESNRHGQTLYEYSPKCRALVGIENGAGFFLGGYNQCLDKVMALLQ
jgi:chromosome partitioning protein